MSEFTMEHARAIVKKMKAMNIPPYVDSNGGEYYDSNIGMFYVIDPDDLTEAYAKNLAYDENKELTEMLEAKPNNNKTGSL